MHIFRSSKKTWHFSRIERNIPSRWQIHPVKTDGILIQKEPVLFSYLYVNFPWSVTMLHGWRSQQREELHTVEEAVMIWWWRRWQEKPYGDKPLNERWFGWILFFSSEERKSNSFFHRKVIRGKSLTGISEAAYWQRRNEPYSLS